MSALTYRSALATDVGAVRRLNEDTPLARDLGPGMGLWAVADGMGGHDAGDYASQTIVTHLAALTPPPEGQTLLANVIAAIGAANRHLIEAAAARGHGSIIGSTLVLLLTQGAQFACLWAGDSRLYRLRAGALTRLSRDHSRVQQLVDSGALPEAESEAHPQAHMITRAVGTDPNLELDKITGRVEPGDVFLLCSDGLTRMVAEAEIHAILAATELDAQPGRLIAAALAHGGKDNVTVVTVRAEAGR